MPQRQSNPPKCHRRDSRAYLSWIRHKSASRGTRSNASFVEFAPNVASEKEFCTSLQWPETLASTLAWLSQKYRASLDCGGLMTAKVIRYICAPVSSSIPADS